MVAIIYKEVMRNLYIFIGVIFLISKGQAEDNPSQVVSIIEPGIVIGNYLFHKEPRTWDEASVICALEGAHLVTVDSKTEELVAADIMKLMGGKLAFTGIHSRNYDGFYESVLGGVQQQLYLNWNNVQPGREGTEKCTAISKTAKLHAYFCDQRLPFICETYLRRYQ